LRWRPLEEEASMQVLADGRARRTGAEWRKILEAFAASGLSASAFCQREGLSRAAFTRWRRRLQEAPSARGAFVELPLPASAERTPLAAGELELVLPGGATLRWKA